MAKEQGNRNDTGKKYGRKPLYLPRRKYIAFHANTVNVLSWTSTSTGTASVAAPAPRLSKVSQSFARGKLVLL
jgi:hypothetical protein